MQWTPNRRENMLNSLFDVLFCVMILFSIFGIANTSGKARAPWFRSGLGGSVVAYAMFLVIYVGTVYTSRDEHLVSMLRAMAISIAAMLISLQSHCSAKSKVNPSGGSGLPSHGCSGD